MGPLQAGHHIGAALLLTVSLEQETFLLFATGINHFQHMGFFQENAFPRWASTFHLVTLAFLVAHWEMCEICKDFPQSNL